MAEQTLTQEEKMEEKPEKIQKINELMDLKNNEDDQKTIKKDSVGAKICHIVDTFIPMVK